MHRKIINKIKKRSADMYYKVNSGGSTVDISSFYVFLYHLNYLKWTCIAIITRYGKLIFQKGSVNRCFTKFYFYEIYCSSVHIFIRSICWIPPSEFWGEWPLMTGSGSETLWAGGTRDGSSVGKDLTTGACVLGWPTLKGTWSYLSALFSHSKPHRTCSQCLTYRRRW